jgi:CheY-like chemotaxis protein
MQLNLHPAVLRVHGDPGMIDQVLLNLAVNARDAMPAGGRLVVKTYAKLLNELEAQALAETSPGPYVCLSVSDNGCGIPAENLDRIFDPFFTTKETGKGTGLGLATVFGIVKQHRGAITVTSEVGKGTTFEVLLPATHEVSQPIDQDSPVLDLPGGSEVILVVEDDEGVRRLTRTLLEEHGYTVLEASDGVEALRVWQENQGQVQLLLTDVVMPEGVSGLELAARIRATDPELKVLFTSGYSPDLAGHELRLEEGQNFLPKPSPPNRILKTVRRCLES